MVRTKNPKSSNSSSGDGLNFEAQFWAAADKMRGHMDASEHKHVCLGLIFLKYISDAFEEIREQLLFGFSDPKSDWFIKEESDRKEAAENRDTTIREANGNLNETHMFAVLLHKLLSGELRVPAAAKVVEATA
jgi:type I restriction-modification system DNA methylase subunit